MKAISQETRENVIQGCFTGLILFASFIVTVNLEIDAKDFLPLYPRLTLILAGYLVMGILIIFIHRRPRHRSQKKDEVLSGLFMGVAFIALLNVFMAPAIFASTFIPDIFRLPMIANILVLFLLWLAEYRTTARASKEMNESLSHFGRSFLEDLPECPKTVDDFLAAIAKYCSRNHIELEIITAERPAIVKMDGVYHKVSLVRWYTYGGLTYSLKFEELTK